MKARIMNHTIEIDDERVMGGVEVTRRGASSRVSTEIVSSSLTPSPTIYKQSFFVTGPLPGMNDYLGKGNHFTYNSHKKRWAGLIASAIRMANLKPMQTVSIEWTWVECEKRRDPDNITGIGKKFILDSLVKCGILKNDGWSQVYGWTDRWVVDREAPGVQVVLLEITKEEP